MVARVEDVEFAPARVLLDTGSAHALIVPESEVPATIATHWARGTEWVHGLGGRVTTKTFLADLLMPDGALYSGIHVKVLPNGDCRECCLGLPILADYDLLLRPDILGVRAMRKT